MPSRRKHQTNALMRLRFRAQQQCAFAWKQLQQNSAQGALTPRQRPNRHGRYHRAPGGRRQRHVVDARRAPGLAAQQPRQRHPAAAPQAETFDRLVAIDRAGRQMPAVVADQRRQRVPIDPDHRAPGIARQALHGAGAVGTCGSANECFMGDVLQLWASICAVPEQGTDAKRCICATSSKISHVLGGSAAKVLWTMRIAAVTFS